MTPQAFIAKWQNNPLKERASYQMHFLDLCELVGSDKPSPASSDDFCFERGATRTGAGHGWADVWKRGCFAFEYKTTGKNLDAALKQLMTYALALDNPPLLVVCDSDIIHIHTHFTGTPSQVHIIALADIGQHDNLNKLKALFNDPDYFRPKVTTHDVTIKAASQLGKIADRLNNAGNTPLQTAHFLIQCVFCMFAEDVRLLPEKLFETVLDKSTLDGKKAQARLAQLFQAMQAGGEFALIDIPWFNGGLFAQIDVPILTTDDVVSLLFAAKMDWRAIEPAILGTLFERGLNPDMRSQLGAHYTDPATIAKIINPVIVEPLMNDWQVVKAQIETQLHIWHGTTEKSENDKYENLPAKISPKKQKAAFEEANALFIRFLETFKTYRVLDPACGSGNFLYLALKALKDCEHLVNLEAEALGLQRQIIIESSPVNVMGIEINPYAAELARVTVWIGELQWMLDHGYALRTNPILQTLDHITQQDALIQFNDDGTTHETQWPACTVIVGNPPFLGDKKMLSELGESYTTALRKWYKGRIAGGADLVTYWFEKARYLIETGQCQRAGLVSTNSIRGGSNRKVLSRIIETQVYKQENPNGNSHFRYAGTHQSTQAEQLHHGASGSSGESHCESSRQASYRGCSGKTLSTVKVGHSSHEMDDGCDNGSAHADWQQDSVSRLIRIFNAYADEPWINAGAAVRVSLVCFGHSAQPSQLNGQPVNAIFADLTAQSESTDNRVDVASAQSLAENMSTAFIGTQKNGAFDVEGDLARHWLTQPNPNGRPNSDVVRPWANGMDITRRPSDTWIIDFGTSMSEADASLYELPFNYVLENVKDVRELVRREGHKKYWWRFGETRLGLRKALSGKDRFIATSMVAKHRFFVWLPAVQIPENLCVAITRSDDTTFGILESRFHKVWALALGTALEDRPRYTPSTTFDTFPFPQGLTPADTTTGVPDTATAKTIALAAQKLNELRTNWLNPSEWVTWTRTAEEVKAGFPLRPVPKAGFENDLKKRTLTNLYNAMPAWLINAHVAIDNAVAKAYGWTDYTPEMPDSEILARLLSLNEERSRMAQAKAA
jgi:type II restriction/modification system DNA methylase subunit YeeA